MQNPKSFWMYLAHSLADLFNAIHIFHWIFFKCKMYVLIKHTSFLTWIFQQRPDALQEMPKEYIICTVLLIKTKTKKISGLWAADSHACITAQVNWTHNQRFFHISHSS